MFISPSDTQEEEVLQGKYPRGWESTYYKDRIESSQGMSHIVSRFEVLKEKEYSSLVWWEK